MFKKLRKVTQILTELLASYCFILEAHIVDQYSNDDKYVIHFKQSMILLMGPPRPGLYSKQVTHLEDHFGGCNTT
jgi:hypothetical protein